MGRKLVSSYNLFVKLFLASMARDPQTIKKLEELLEGFKGKSLAYIPTAGNAEGWGSWKNGNGWKLIQTLETNLTVVQLEDFSDKSVLSQLRGKDIIWFAGGYPGYLSYWARRCQLDKYLKQILDQGSLYVGTSAGSMVAGKTLEVTEWYPGEPENGAGVIPGLGLVDFDIYPHLQDDQLKFIKQKYKGPKLYLLKDGEHILVEDEKVTVEGEERIIDS